MLLPLTLLCLLSAVSVEAGTGSTFKLAFFNIKGGKGQIALAGFPSTFADTTNCTDSTQPLNAWGTGFVQSELVSHIANDPAVVALGLAESWVCATPGAVRTALGWAANTTSQNGVALVAKYGFAGPEQWTQLDTSLNTNPSDTMWVLSVPVCLDSACSESILVFTAHWYATGATNFDSYTEADTQAQQTLTFMNSVAGVRPHVLLGDLNVFGGTQVVCGQNPKNEPIQMMRGAGYVDAWASVNGLADGFTGMWNRNGCGTPNGNLWKRIDYAWSHNVGPLSIAQFGIVSPGNEAPSDHAGIVAEYPLPSVLASSVPPTASISAPAESATVSGQVPVTVDAQDDLAVTRVELFVDGVLQTVLPWAPFTCTWDTTVVPNGTHGLQAAASDGAGNRTLSAVRTVTVENPVGPGDEIVLYGGDGTIVGSNWQMQSDSTAAGGIRLQNADLGAPAPSTAAASPASYVEWSFTPVAGKAYRIWIRGRALGDSPTNDAVYAQYTGSVDAFGAAAFRIGTTSGAPINLEDCGGCGLSGWGWQDDGYPTDVLGPVVYFTGTGPQRLRIQALEDGLGIDQIVLSTVQYMTQPPGAFKNDTTILPKAAQNNAPTVTLTSPTSGATFTAPASIQLAANASEVNGTIARVEFYAGATLIATTSTSPYAVAWNNVAAGAYSLTARAIDSAGATATSTAVSILVQATSTSGVDEVVRYASEAPVIVGNWFVTADMTAAGGARLQNPNLGAAKLTTPLAAPADYFELTFNADAGKAYHLWLRGKAQNDDYLNDSVYVQFDGSVDATGVPIDRIGTTSAEAVVIEDCSGCGLSGWGWADNAYGLGALGRSISFAQSGQQRIRIQAREDGIGLDQIVLSAVKYMTTSPGTTKNDTTILPETDTTATNAPPTVTFTSPTSGASYTAPATIALAATASDSDGTVARVDFYVGTTLIGSATTSPYTATWSGVPAGTYSLTARATDSAGAVTTSAAVTVQVLPATNNPPTVTLTSPANNASYKAPATIVLAATASDSDGGIVRVEFYSGTTLIGTSTAAPYTVTWNNVPAGMYTLTAKAIDTGQVSTTSAAVTVHVKRR